MGRDEKSEKINEAIHQVKHMKINLNSLLVHIHNVLWLEGCLKLEKMVTLACSWRQKAWVTNRGTLKDMDIYHSERV